MKIQTSVYLKDLNVVQALDSTTTVSSETSLMRKALKSGMIVMECQGSAQIIPSDSVSFIKIEEVVK